MSTQSLDRVAWAECRVVNTTGSETSAPPPGRSSGLLGITEATLVPQALASPLPHVSMCCRLWTPPFPSFPFETFLLPERVRVANQRS